MIVGLKKTPSGKCIPQARRDRIVVLPREDLDQCLISATIEAPGVALGDAPSFTADATAVCQVVHIGPGTLEDPDVGEVVLGDIVMFDLFGVSQAVNVDGIDYLTLPFRGVRAVMRNPGDREHEVVQPVNDWVLSQPAPEEMIKHFYRGVKPPDGVLERGYATDDGDCSKAWLDRIVSCGSGVMTKLGLDAPNLDPGTLACISAVEALDGSAPCTFRRFGQKYRLSPAERVTFTLEDGEPEE